MLTDAQIAAYIRGVLAGDGNIDIVRKSRTIANFMAINGISPERVARAGNITVDQVNAYLAAGSGQPTPATGGTALPLLIAAAAALLFLG